MAGVANDRKWWAALVAGVLLAGAWGEAQAGLYQDDLGRCVVQAATQPDRDVLMQWVFAAMAANPKISDMANVPAKKAEELSRNAVTLMERLLLTDCRKQAADAVKYEGAGAIQHAFSLLGQVAMSDMMRDEGTRTYLGSLQQYMDKEAWSALQAEMSGDDK